MSDEERGRVIAAIVDIVEPQLPAGVRLVAGGPVLAPRGWLRPDLVIGRWSPGMAPSTAIYISAGGPINVRSLADRCPRGTDCLWQVCVRQPAGFRGPVPVIIVRWRSGGEGWRERFHLRNRVGRLPICVAAQPDRPTGLISVALDPGDLPQIQRLGLSTGKRRRSG